MQRLFFYFWEMGGAGVALNTPFFLRGGGGGEPFLEGKKAGFGGILFGFFGFNRFFGLLCRKPQKPKHNF